MCIDMCIDMRIDMRIGMCLETVCGRAVPVWMMAPCMRACEYACVYMRADMRMDMRMDIDVRIGTLPTGVNDQLYIGSILASPTACLLRGYGRAEAVILGTGTPIPAQ